jgi:5'-nucleotidase
MLRIALDMDEVVADVMPKFLDLFEQYNGRKPSPEELAGRKIYELPGGKQVRQHIYDKGFFLDLPLIPGAKEGVLELSQHYEIFFVTAAQEFRNSLEDKYDWLLQHFPFVDWRHFVFCGDKSVIQTDYLLDDHAFNLRTFSGKGLLFMAYHKLNETDFTRLNNWSEVLSFFENERAVKSASF